MRTKRANIDSLNLSHAQLEALFIHHEDYIIEAVKTKSVFNPTAWSKAFGKTLTQNIIEAKIIHSYLGLRLPLKTYSSSKDTPVVEFAGLHGYNERSTLLTQTLRELESQLQDTRVMRIDIAIDFKGKIPKSITRALSKTREPFRWKNTTYYKTAKEKKVNNFMDIKVYDKALHAGLDYPMMRLEFCFKNDYLKKVQLKDIESLYPKMQKSIKKATGLSVKIERFFSL